MPLTIRYDRTSVNVAAQGRAVMLSLHYRAHEKGLPSNIVSWLVIEYFFKFAS